MSTAIRFLFASRTYERDDGGGMTWAVGAAVLLLVIAVLLIIAEEAQIGVTVLIVKSSFVCANRILPTHLRPDAIPSPPQRKGYSPKRARLRTPSALNPQPIQLVSFLGVAFGHFGG